MNSKLTLCCAALVAAVPMMAVAGPSYNYADLGYVQADPSGQSALTGFGGGAVFSFSDNFHYVVGHTKVDNSGRTTSATLLAGGFNMPISDRSDFVARLGWAWERNRLTGIPGSLKDDGIAASIGIRTVMSEQFELSGMVNYANTFRSRTSLGIEGVYYFTDNLGIVGGGDFGSRANVLRIGMRFSFEGY